MAQAILDLENFNSIIGDDPVLAKLIFADFTSTSEQNLEAMAHALQTVDREVWRGNAHKMKGACRNLGAFLLGDLLARAERCEEIEKSGLLKEIQNAYRDVLQAWQDTH